VRTHFRQFGAPLLLLMISAVSTTASGARFMQNFRDGMPLVVRGSDLWPWGWVVRNLDHFSSGWTFSSALLGILLLHESGHYFACRWHGVRSSLPWVLPAPTFSGTVGAVIRIRSRISSRMVLMDLGLFGPLAGYLASLVAVAVGLVLSKPTFVGTPNDAVRLGVEPLTIRLIHSLLVQWNPSIPDFDHLAPHPVLMAGWIGLFITALNLIPGGQLDGGHILYALSPRWHRAFTIFLPYLLFLAGIFFWAGWIFWGFFLMIPTMRHPRVSPESCLDRSRMVLGGIGVGLFLLTFTPAPFDGNSLLQLFHVQLF
jgi:membrane-associated protease RseP (regulator of RpoE activity)